MTPGDWNPLLPPEQDESGGLQERITVHAAVSKHGDQLYLIPHSDRRHAGQNHSLIRLMDSATSTASEILRSMLNGGTRVSGQFMLAPGDFAEDGVLMALLVEIIDCSAAPPTEAAGGGRAAQVTSARWLMMLSRWLWSRRTP